MMEIDDAKVLFSQSSFLPIHGFELEEGLMEIMSRAKRKIILCTCEFNSKSDFLLTQKISEKLNVNCEIIVYGNNRKQLNALRNSFESPSLKVNLWNPPNEKSLFHIKAVLIDDTFVYIGSANLSINAMSNSAEWGITGNSSDLCKSLQEYICKLEQLNLFEVIS